MKRARQIPRAVLEAEHEAMEARRRRWRIFLVQFGVYAALLAGVIGSQAIVMADNLSATLKPIELGQVIGSTIVAGALYNKLEGKGEINGKTKNIGRMIRNAVYHGFFWMTILGAWW